MISRRLLRLVRFGVLGAAAVPLALFLRSHSTYRIPDTDESLAPRYPSGSRVMVKDLDADDPVERGTDVVYEMEREGKIYARFGRVLGLPGDRLEVREGRLSVNGTLHAIGGPAPESVPEGTLFVVAPNPLETRYPDSRTLGCIPRGRIRGRILTRLALGG